MVWWCYGVIVFFVSNNASSVLGDHVNTLKFKSKTFLTEK